MRYVDEYRDPELARHLSRRIAAAVEPGRHYNQLMGLTSLLAKLSLFFY